MSDALDTLAAWGRARRPARVLDLATGDARAALAFVPIARTLTVYDSLPVLTTARARLTGAGPSANVRYAAGEAVALPFADEVFDLVTCRLAAHRFAEPAATLREVRRVLRPGGALLLHDLRGHDEAETNALVRTLKARHDPRYVRAYRTAEWKAFLRAAGLTVMEESTATAVHAWNDFTEGLTPETTRDLERMLREAPERVRRALDVRLDGNAIESFAEPTLLVRAERD